MPQGVLKIATGSPRAPATGGVLSYAQDIDLFLTFRRLFEGENQPSEWHVAQDVPQYSASRGRPQRRRLLLTERDRRVEDGADIDAPRQAVILGRLANPEPV